MLSFFGVVGVECGVVEWWSGLGELVVFFGLFVVVH